MVPITVHSQQKKSTSVKSPKPSKQGSLVLAKSQVEVQKEGQHLVAQLPEQQQDLPMAGARAKYSTSNINSVNFMQPLSKQFVPIQDSAYHILSVQGVSGQHSILHMSSHKDAQLTQQGTPGAGMSHNSHSFVTQIHQGQILSQISGHGANQRSLPEQGVTLTHFMPSQTCLFIDILCIFSSNSGQRLTCERHTKALRH